MAIDLDRREARLVVYEATRPGAAIVSMHATTLPAEMDASDSLAVGRYLRNIIHKLGLDNAEAIMCIGRSQAVLKSLALPPGVGPDELAGMVQLQASREMPFGADEAVIDFIHTQHGTSDQPSVGSAGTTVLAAAVRLPLVDAARQLCEEAGLKLRRLTLRPQANLETVYRSVHAEPGERILFVHLTNDEAEIDVMCDESLEFSRSALIAPATPAAGAQVDRKDPLSRDAPAAAAPDERAQRVAGEVLRSLQSYHSLPGGGEIQAVLVAGATGLEQPLARLLHDKLKVSCELFDPSAAYRIVAGREVSAFSAALGMAGGAGAQTVAFDFLNPKRPMPVRDTRRARAIVWSAVAAFLLGAVALATHLHGASQDSLIATLQDDHDKATKENKQLVRFNKRLADVRKWKNEDVKWLDQLAHLSNTFPPAEQVYLNNLRCSPYEAKEAGGRATVGGRVTVAGHAKDGDLIGRLQRQLLPKQGYDVLPKPIVPVADQFGYPMGFSADVLITNKAQPLVASDHPAGRPADDVAGQTRPPRPAAPAAGSTPPAATPKPTPAAVSNKPNQPAAQPLAGGAREGGRRGRGGNQPAATPPMPDPPPGWTPPPGWVPRYHSDGKYY